MTIISSWSYNNIIYCFGLLQLKTDEGLSTKICCTCERFVNQVVNFDYDVRQNQSTISELVIGKNRWKKLGSKKYCVRERNYECCFCHQKFSSNSKTTRHNKDKHLPRQFLCKCGSVFARKSHLKDHAKNCLTTSKYEEDDVLKFQAKMYMVLEKYTKEGDGENVLANPKEREEFEKEVNNDPEILKFFVD